MHPGVHPFGGGGHRRAAGAELREPLETARKRVLDVARPCWADQLAVEASVAARPRGAISAVLALNKQMARLLRLHPPGPPDLRGATGRPRRHPRSDGAGLLPVCLEAPPG